MTDALFRRPLARTTLAALILPWLLATPALAQGIVGKAIVEGKPVILFEDRTWTFEDPSADCAILSAKITFCGAALGWLPSTIPTPDVMAAFRLNDLTYANFIYEDLGTTQGLTVEGVREILLKIVQNQTGQVATVIETTPAMVDGKNAETLIYAFKVSGLDVVYANTFVLGSTSLLQAQTYSIGQTYTDEHRKAHTDFLNAIQYSGE